MARKNLLKDLIETATTDTPAPTVRRPHHAKGTIGAVSQSIAELKSRAIAEIDPATIDQGGLFDRLEYADADHKMMVASLRDHGQQVPVLLRPHPQEAGRFQIVYGRRRVRAMRELGLPVKAMIRDLDDRDLVIAQGQENTARKDLTFIEKANFARQMRETGYPRKIICDALHVDKTQVSRMLAVADAVPLRLIEAIGAAPSVGRNRWLALAELLNKTETTVDEAIDLVHLSELETSDGRFTALMVSLTGLKPTPGRAAIQREVLRDSNGTEIGSLVRKSDRVVLTIHTVTPEGFEAWFVENFVQIHENWLSQGKAEDPES